MLTLSSNGKVLTLSLTSEEVDTLSLPLGGLDLALETLSNLHKKEIVSYLLSRVGDLEGVVSEYQEGKRVVSTKGKTTPFTLLNLLNSSAFIYESSLEYRLEWGKDLDFYYRLIIEDRRK